MKRPLFLALCCVALAAWREPQPPAPPGEPGTNQQLKATRQSIEKSAARQQELAVQTGKVSGELKGLQKELVSLAETIRKNEHGLLDAEDKLGILNRELAEKSVALKEQRTRLAAMVQAAIRLSRTPPEAGIMMPGEFGQAALAARVLSSLTLSIRHETESIAAQMAELEELKQKVQQSHQRIDADQTTLMAEQHTLDSKLSERRRLAKQLLREQEDVKKRMGELSRQARDLQELLSALEKSRREQEEKEARTPHPAQPRLVSGRLRPFAGAKGALAMPVEGHLVRRFGDSMGRNETSKGALIRARAGASVVAPYDGEVVFTGPFLNYGNMVILRHSDDFHTLLAGFDTVAVSVGEFLLEGEPIGAMGENPAGMDLYVELRERNKPIDPVPWISGLK